MTLLTSSPPGLTRWSMLSRRNTGEAAVTPSQRRGRMDCRVKPGNDENESVLATHSRARALRTTTTEKNSLQVEGSGAPKGACQSMSAVANECAGCATHLLRGRASPAGGAPPFGAHACGTRHRLSPRWLSPRTGFPEDGPSASVLPARPCCLRLSTLRADRSLCRSTGDPEPPGSGWQIRARAPPLAFVFQACLPERRPP
jgi:hypothetical protein